MSETQAEYNARWSRKADAPVSDPPDTRYETFLARKLAIDSGAAGIPDPGPLEGDLFPFQSDLVRFGLRRGRAAIFADCGLGKTAVQLTWADRVARATNTRVLILAPLAVSQQTIREAAKFEISCSYAREQSEVCGPVTVTNYERLHRFDAGSFGGVVLDESGILKSFMGKTKRLLLQLFERTPFRLACTATPAPNDHLELGNHAEFLGELTSHEMIARFFINDTSTMGTYRLKHYAVAPFWDWVSSWARCLGSPADLGYPAGGFELPPLELRLHPLSVDVVADRGDKLFRIPDLSAASIHKERRRTAVARAEKIAELVAAEPDEPWILWCETDYEADALKAAIPDALEVRGPDSLEAKEERLEAFSSGTARILLSKPSICGHGLNWQHCARVAFIGPTFSYESYYQAIRRSWRFGQTRPVHVHMVVAQTEAGVWDILSRKSKDHERMKLNMFAAARRAQCGNDSRAVQYDPRRVARLPEWLKEEVVS